jgi:2C-methyl-D-erythritol 2,4-cyclodiphosphate synthase
MGERFGTNREEWKDAPSRKFVEVVLEKTRPARVVNVDVTIVGARPRIADSRDRMRDLIAELLAVPVSAVSVKASSGNGVGELGRGEAIAATVVVLVEEKSEDLGIPPCPGSAHEAAEGRPVSGGPGGAARCTTGGTGGAGALF